MQTSRPARTTVSVLAAVAATSAIALFLVPGLAGGDVAGERATPDVRQGPFVHFVESPGAEEFSGQLIARPWQPEHWQGQGLNEMESQARIEQAHQLITDSYAIHRYVWQTDEFVFDVPEGATENTVANELLATGLYQYVHPNWIVYPVQNCPDDPLLNQQWHHPKIESCAGWEYWTGSTDITVGICDTGIRVTHEDLLLHRKEGYNAVTELWESQGGDISEIYPHGTAVTGCAAANSDNGIGVAGVGWNFSHRMLRVTNNANSGSSTIDILNHASRTAIEAGDRVANVSYNGVNNASVRTTATYIKSIGGLLVWAAGNSNQNLNWGHRDDDDVIVVGASTSNDSRASFSNYGLSVDFFAPGVDILTSRHQHNSHYGTVSGTSFAAPLASGLIALIWSADPTLTPDEVEYIIKQSCDNIGNSNTFGYGRINVRKAMEMINFSDPCPWDLDGNGVVDGGDLGLYLANWGVCGDCNDCPCDFTGNCQCGGAGLGELLANWGPCP